MITINSNSHAEMAVMTQPPANFENFFTPSKDKNLADWCDFSYKENGKKVENPFLKYLKLPKVKKEEKVPKVLPKVAKPSATMDVTKNLYEGSPKFLDMFLGKGKLKGQGKTFLKAQEKYGINAVFLIAIAKLESADGTSNIARNNNNFGGMRTSKGYLKFKSVEEGIDRMASNLKRLYIDDGLVTVEQIHKRHASDPGWTDKVVNNMKKMHKLSRYKIWRL